MAWVVLLASASAVVLVGLLATVLVLGRLDRQPVRLGLDVAAAFLVASGLTLVSLGLRSLRWIFLLRRAGTRIPIRDAYIGYFGGLSLLLAPFLLGEIAVRASILRSRGRVPVSTTVLVNLWERFLDLVAIGVIASALDWLLEGMEAWNAAALVLAAATFAKPVRRAFLFAGASLSNRGAALAGFDEPSKPADLARLAGIKAWLTALVASVIAWALPGVGFWVLARSWRGSFGLLEALRAYAVSAGLGGLIAAPGGVIVAGGQLLESLILSGFEPAAAAIAVLGIRLATVGVATALGAVFLLVHWQSPGALDRQHFDAIADAYDVQIPESRRRALLLKKTDLMCDVLRRFDAGPSGLDVGCGQGAYVARMRELGFDVSGIDSSAGQVALASRNVAQPDVVAAGSVLDIPAPDGSYDFVYIINVLHHLSSVDEQRRAFSELLRVLRPGGLLMVHEINTRNVLFRFYMGYVFPSLNCIDEGVERWLLPHRFAVYTDAPVVEIRYFTFLPDFLPQGVVRLLMPFERLIERSPLGVYSAHFMAVVRKEGA
jgi:SAM-dependent methyltransferase